MTRWTPTGPAILFTPADRPERFEKALERADMVIVDLEDGCQPENKQRARDNIRSANLDPRRTIVRINPAGTEDFERDISVISDTDFSQVMLPKVERRGDVDKCVQLISASVIALIETPMGVINAPEIAAAEGLVALFWGAEDLVAGLGGSSSRFADGTYRDLPRFARAQVQLAAAAHNKAALDSVYVDIKDVEGLGREAADAAALGYAATVCIHPSQADIIRAHYQPSEERIDWARRLLKEAENNRGAFSFEGRMVDEPLFRQAQAITNRVSEQEGQ